MPAQRRLSVLAAQITTSSLPTSQLRATPHPRICAVAGEEKGSDAELEAMAAMALDLDSKQQEKTPAPGSDSSPPEGAARSRPPQGPVGPDVLAATQADLYKKLADESGDTRREAVASLWRLWHAERGPAAEQALDRATGLIQGNPEKAVDVLLALSEEHEGWAEPLNKLATIYYMQGKFEESAEMCKRVLALKPYHFACLSGLIMCYTRLQQPTLAKETAQRLARVSPSLGAAPLEQLEQAALAEIQNKYGDTPVELVKQICAHLMRGSGPVPKSAPERLKMGSTLFAKVCSLLVSFGLPKGTGETRDSLEDFAVWLQTRFFDTIDADEHGRELREYARKLNKQVYRMVKTQEFAEFAKLNHESGSEEV